MASQVNINGINCSFAMPGGRLSISESSAEDGPRKGVVFQCDWADRWDLVKNLRGTCTGSASGFTRTPPYAHPENANLVCVGVGEFEYLGSGVASDGTPYADQVKLPAHFACVPWQFVDNDPAGQNDASGQAWTVTKLKPSAEVYQPTGGSYFLGPFPSTTPLDEASVGLLRANTEIQQTRKFMPAIALGAIDSAIGRVNSNPMTFGTKTYTLDKVLLIAIETSDPYFDCIGNPVLDITYTYLARANSWNAVQDRTGAWQLLNSAANGMGTEPFSPYDFSSLPR